MRPCWARSPAPAPPRSPRGARRSGCSRWPPSRFGTGRHCWMRSPPRWRGGRTLRRIHIMMILALILVVALLIPITAILVDSPLGRSIARRLEGRSDEGGSGGGGSGGGNLRDLQHKVDVLESDVEELNRSLSATREELQFLQRLL